MKFEVDLEHQTIQSTMKKFGFTTWLSPQYRSKMAVKTPSSCAFSGTHKF